MRLSQFWAGSVLAPLMMVAAARAQTTNHAGLMYLPETPPVQFNSPPASDFWTGWATDFTRRADAGYADRFLGAELDWARAVANDGYDLHDQVDRTGYQLFRHAVFSSLREEISHPFRRMMESRTESIFGALFAGSIGNTAEENLDVLPRNYGENERLWLESVPPAGNIGCGLRPWNGYAYANARLGPRFATDVRYVWDLKAGKVEAHLVYKVGRVRLLSGIVFKADSANQAEWSGGAAYDSRPLTCFVGLTRQGSVNSAVLQASLVF